MVSGAWEGLKERTVKMLEDPGFYSIGNWATLGLFDVAKGSTDPEEPLSLEHWLNAIGFAAAVYGIYEIVECSIKIHNRQHECQIEVDSLDSDSVESGLHQSTSQLKENESLEQKSSNSASIENDILRSGKLAGRIDRLTDDERKVVYDLLDDGNDVEIITRSDTERMPDFRVNGVKTELKTLNGGSINTPIT